MNTIKLSDHATKCASSYIKLATKRSISESATVALLSKNYKSHARDAIIASRLAENISRTFLYSLTRQGGAEWLVSILSGTFEACPVDKASGLYSHSVIQYFVKHGKSVASKIANDKERASEARKAKKEAQSSSKELESDEAKIVKVDAEVLCSAKSLFAAYLTLSDSERAAFKTSLDNHTRSLSKTPPMRGVIAV